jgi:hypothetical protein
MSPAKETCRNDEHNGGIHDVDRPRASIRYPSSLVLETSSMTITIVADIVQWWIQHRERYVRGINTACGNETKDESKSVPKNDRTKLTPTIPSAKPPILLQHALPTLLPLFLSILLLALIKSSNG